MIRSFIYWIFMMLPPRERMRVATWRFRAVREMFYRETRLDVAAKGLRNRETLLERLRVLEQRHRSRRALFWPVFRQIGENMVKGDDFAIAMKPFIPQDEFSLLDLARTSTQADAAIRGLELAEMAAHAKRVLSGTTSLEMAYPAVLIVYLYGYCMLFGGAIFPQVLETKPVETWPVAGQMLYAFDTFCYRYWWLTGAVITGLVSAYFWTLKRWTGEARNRLDAAPLMWRNRRDLRGALLIVSFSGFFDSGLTLRAAIDRLTRNADPWMRWHLNRMGRRLTEHPHQPMRALDTGIFSEMVVDTITDAAGRDQFVQAIKDLGRNSLSLVVEAVRRNAKVTHYVLLGFAAGAFIVLCVGSYVMTGAASLSTPDGSTVNSFNTAH